MTKKHMNVFKSLTAAALIVAGTTGVTNADSRLKVGVLTCEVEGGAGFVLGSSKDLECTFESTSGYNEQYAGTVKKFGVDIGKTDRALVKWLVLAPSADIERGSLRGNYAGVSGEVTLGAGVGANAMIGGFEDSIVLQPFSGQVQEGLNIAVGIGTIRLHSI